MARTTRPTERTPDARGTDTIIMAKKSNVNGNATNVNGNAGKLVRRNGTRKPAITAPSTATAAPALPAPAPASVPDAVITAARTVTVGNIVERTRAACAGVTVGNRSVGRYTGMRIQQFQNATFEWNRTWSLDDVQLAYVWTVEYPGAIGRVFALNGRMMGADAVNGATVADVVGIIRGVRAHYNRTGHHGPVPAVPSVSFGPTGRIAVPAPSTATADVPPAADAAPVVNGKTRKPRARKTA